MYRLNAPLLSPLSKEVLKTCSFAIHSSPLLIDMKKKSMCDHRKNRDTYKTYNFYIFIHIHLYDYKCNRITGWSYPKSVISSAKKEAKWKSFTYRIAIRRNMRWMRIVTHKRNQYEEFLIYFTYPCMSSRDLARCRSWFRVNPLHQAAFR